METIKLEIEMDNGLVAKTRELAIRYFGNDSDESLTEVLEMAFKMRCIWSRFLRIGQQETDEAISTWEFPESTIKRENGGSIQDWLFRR